MNGNVFTGRDQGNRCLAPPVGSRCGVQGAVTAKTGERGLEQPSMLTPRWADADDETEDDE